MNALACVFEYGIFWGYVSEPVECLGMSTAFRTMRRVMETLTGFRQRLRRGAEGNGRVCSYTFVLASIDRWNDAPTRFRPHVIICVLQLVLNH